MSAFAGRTINEIAEWKPEGVTKSAISMAVARDSTLGKIIMVEAHDEHRINTVGIVASRYELLRLRRMIDLAIQEYDRDEPAR